MAGRLLRAAGGARALLSTSVPGPCPRRGCASEEEAAAAGPEREAEALLAMGFSQAQARRLRELQPRLGPRRAAAALEQLLLLGLGAEAALGLLERSPELLRAAEGRLKERAEYLRRLGLGGGSGGKRGEKRVKGGLGSTPASARYPQGTCSGRPGAARRSSPCPGGGWRRRCGCCGRNASSRPSS